MRHLFFILLLLPFISFAQRQDVFIKLTDLTGKQISGDAILRGFERQIQVFTANSGGKNNVQFSFAMNITGASADLKKAMGTGDFLNNGLVSFIQLGASDAAPKIVYTIKMEKIKVLSCAEAMGCNGINSIMVTLQATRIGWTYYQNNLRSGPPVISNKYGYDAETSGQWTNF